MPSAVASSPPAGPPAAGPAVIETVAFGRRTSLQDLHRAIPPACLQRSVPRQLLGIAANLAGMALSWWLLAVNPYPWLLPILWFFAGTTAWGLMVIAHECGHGAFSKNRRLNHFFGNLLMTPFLYPFHGWRLLHHHHHTNTNSIEKDIDWRPMPVAIYMRLPWRTRTTYRLIRTWFWWAGTLHQLFTQAFDSSHVAFEKPRDKAYLRFSTLCVLIFALIFFPLAFFYLGVWGVLKFYVMPWLVCYGWFSLTTFMHHTHPEVPFLDRKSWTPAASNLCMTVYCKYPRWMEFFGHDINVHSAHHVAPSIPYFHLRQAQRALKESFPEQVREFRFSFQELWQRLSRLHLYDKKTGLYMSFQEASRRHGKKRRSA
ncbi:MAG: fatty acid desaturase [Planctomycetota bacterium]|nr:MAG: fatty acid desaturase [Planctomycetota bacterium]